MNLTLPQRDIYFEQLLFPNDPVYNIGAKIAIKGNLDLAALNQAYSALINQHDAYRTTVHKQGETVELKVQAKQDLQLSVVDFSTKENADQYASEYMQNAFLKPFDLLGGNLLHTFELIRVNDDFHYLFSFYHHIITDGWGTSLMFQRLVQNYNEILEHGEIQTEYPFSYQDFVTEDQEYQNSERFQKDKEYWVEKFNTLPESLFEKNNDVGQSNISQRKAFYIKRQQYNQLNLLAKELKVSTFHLILAVLYAYFGRVQENNDFGIGLPVLNRGSFAYKRTVGLFMGINSLRIQLDFEESFSALAKKIRQQLRMDYRYQRFPFGKLIQELGVFKEKEKLFNISLSYEKQDYSTNFINTKTRVIPLSHHRERVALAIYIREFDKEEDVKIDFDYNLNYFNVESITKVVEHFQNLLQEILKDPEKQLKELNYLSSEEENTLLKAFNKTTATYPKSETFLHLFEEKANQHPDQLAIEDDQNSYTYQALGKTSSLLAAYLHTAFGENDKSPIAVLMDRSANMLVLLLGIMKAGRPYIPLDPSFPEDRLRYILKHSQARLMIHEKGYEVKGSKVKAFDLDTIFEHIKNSKEIVLPQVLPTDSAYIIYTSGSTGKPKGVEVGHQALLNFLTSIQQKPGIGVGDKLFSVTTYSFDISILEFFVPLIASASLYIADKQTLADPKLTILKIEAEQTTLIQATPSFYQMLFDAGWQGDNSLKVLCGGDLLSKALAEKLLEHCKELWNMYGPTETTIWSSTKKIEKASQASNIGQPIRNTQFYILDQFLNPMPVGTRGAIYIGGDGLAKGYYLNPELTGKKFIPNPFEDGLMYETGDVGKWNEQGEIEFLGRNDNQVKIRGFRIELGEIETKLNQFPEIAEAVVIAKKEAGQDAFLVAYIREAEPIDKQAIIDKLKTELPVYMIPYTILTVSKFPLTPNQKVDRKSLANRAVTPDRTVSSRLPKSDLELEMVKHWKTILGIEHEIGIQDNFFMLGGHSLNATRLISLINKEYACNIGLKFIFDHPTIEEFVHHLQVLQVVPQVSIPLAEIKEYYPITAPQYLLWLAAQRKEQSIAYNMSAAYQIEGEIKVSLIKAAIDKIIEKYEILRTNFVVQNNIPQQRINPVDQVNFKVDSSTINTVDADKHIEAIINQEFDLEKDLLLRIHVLYLEEKAILLFSTHHIIMDGWSLSIFLQEFVQNYNQKTPEGLDLQFKDCAVWLNQQVESNKQETVAFWDNYYTGARQEPSFIPDFDQPHIKTTGVYPLEFGDDNSEKINQLCHDHGVTAHTFLAASLTLLIVNYSSKKEVSIAMTNSGRTNADLNQQIGMFVKTLVLNETIIDNQPFGAFLKQIQENILEIDKHQHVPQNILSKFDFDVMLTFQNPEFSHESVSGMNNFNLSPYPIKNQYSRFPIVFNFYEEAGKIKGSIEYHQGLFTLETIKMIDLMYQKIITELLNNPSINIGDLDLSLTISNEETIDIDFDF